ncbi:hypothetical protein AB0M43_28915 [Longispora sp. NPDC051575]|uniref:hypothetical protein n=1 Tax=Longispora sp. NPDC051575 TaxID=3154943 RepID=UPI003425959F
MSKPRVALLAFCVATAALVVPTPAHAAPGSAHQVTVLRGADQPKPHSVTGPAGQHPVAQPAGGAAVAASGGGCVNVSDARPCVSYRSKALWGDFYLNSRTRGQCKANVFIFVNGQPKYQYTVDTYSLGHYPLDSEPVSGSGRGYTSVDFLDCSGRWIFTANSPDQYWP